VLDTVENLDAVVGKTITHVAVMYGLESEVFILDDDTVVAAFGSAGQGWFSVVDYEGHGWKLEDLKSQSLSETTNSLEIQGNVNKDE